MMHSYTIDQGKSIFECAIVMQLTSRSETQLDHSVWRIARLGL